MDPEINSHDVIEAVTQIIQRNIILVAQYISLTFPKFHEHPQNPINTMKPATILRRQARATFLRGAGRGAPQLGYTHRQYSDAIDASIKTDQTKKNNSPGEDHESAHKDLTSNTEKGDRAETNTAKQADPQPPPSKTTGIQPSGPDGEAKARR